MTEPRFIVGSAPRSNIAAHGRVLACLLAATALLTLLAAGPGVLPADVAITRFVQEHTSGPAGAAFAITNWLGLAPVGIAVAIALAVALLASGRAGPALLLALAPGAWAANASLKALAASPRPTAELVGIAEEAAGFGFPSGHVMGTTVLAVLAYTAVRQHIARRWMRLGAGFLLAVVLLVSGLGRIAVGAHWPTDVLGAYLWGVLLSVALVRLHGALLASLARPRRPASRRGAPHARSSSAESSAP